MTRLEVLLADGTLTRLAPQCRTQAELARAVGMTPAAYESAAKRLRSKGIHHPTLFELQRGGTVIAEAREAAADFAEEEPTNPSAQAAQEPKTRTISDDLADRRHRAEVASLKSRLADALGQLEQCRYELGAAVAVNDALHAVEPIRPRERTSGLREATAVMLASDWHIEETVDEAAVNGVNRYDLDIARRRVERYFSSAVYLGNYHTDHFAIRDQVLWLGGDLITGYLREEDLESNSLSPVRAVATLQAWLVDGIRSILQGTQVETLRIVCNSGNHGRLTKKVQPRTREANSIEWLLYHMLAREFADEPRIKFILPHGTHTYVEIYDWVFRFTHGDATKYSGGVGGIMIPIRKAIAKWQTVRNAHVNVMGHYHSEHFLRDLIVNGSLVGYNEFALEIAASFEEPRQGFFLVDKHRGVSMPSTMWVEDRRQVA